MLLVSAMLACLSAEGGTARPRVLRLARVNDPATLDPLFATSQIDLMLSLLQHQPLLDIHDGCLVATNLASGWSVSPDQRVLSFDLLPGVRFSNGREVTSEDYAFTLERSIIAPTMMVQYALQIRGAPEFASAWRRGLRPPPRPVGIRTPSPRSIVVELEKPDVTFKYWMAQAFGMALARESLGDPTEDSVGRAVGTGPYRMREWVRGAWIRFERNPHYLWPGARHFDRIDLMLGGDESTHMMMFERGELDLASLQATGCPEADFARLHQDPVRRSGWTNAPMYHAIMVNINTAMPPFTDIRVRQAVGHAFDRERFARLNGERVTPGHTGITPLMPGFHPEVEYLHFDPERSRALLREAGYPDGIRTPVRLWHTNIQLYRRWAAVFQEDLRRVGIAVELREVSQGVFDAATSRRGGAEMSIFAWTAGVPDASYFLLPFHSRFISEENSQNGAFYSNSTIDRWLDEAMVCPAEQPRLGLFRRVEQQLLSEGSLIVLGHQNLFALRQPWIRGPLLEPVWWFRLDHIWSER
ncbi:MAG TPA: hypothetical protein DCM86_01560 [Verrucomicrobiales bacterium]|nr:hypothetical protein [Verrucomicrobiales bacterium]